MQSLAGKPGARTVFKIGEVQAPVILHNLTGEPPKLADYATAGPHGRPLRVVDRAVVAAPKDTSPGEAVPVQKGEPMRVGSRSPEELRQIGDVAHKLAEAAPVQPGAPTRDVGPGEMRRVLIEEPGEGETEAGMPELTREDTLRGIRQADGTFIDLTAQLADIEARTKLETMEVVSTMDVGQVPRDRVQGSMFIGSDSEKAPHVLRVTMEAMRQIRRVPVVAWTVKSRQSLGVVTVRSDGALILLRLSWAEDVRAPGERQLAHLKAMAYQAEVDAMAELLLALSETKREGLDTMRDQARELREELEAKAIAGEVDAFEFAPEPSTPVGEELADILKASAEQVRAARTAA